jgi:hypothetical protein
MTAATAEMCGTVDADDTAEEKVANALGPSNRFALNFFRSAVPPARVAEIVQRVVGDDVEFGPVDVGPRKLASATAVGERGVVRASRVGDDPSRLRVQVPVDLTVTVHLGFEVAALKAHVTVELNLWIELCEPLSLVVHIAEPSAEDVRLRVEPSGATGRVLHGLGLVEPEINQCVRQYVRATLASPTAQRYTRINLEELIEVAWQDLLDPRLDVVVEQPHPPPARRPTRAAVLGGTWWRTANPTADEE